MRMFLLLYSVYFTVISAYELCPDGCECRAKIISCVGRELLHIPKWLPKDVTNLDLSGNRISSIKNNTLLEFSNLVKLNLSDNDITDTENLGKLPKSLQNLNLKGNNLKSLSGSWKQFTILDFSHNRIETIGNGTFANCTNLEDLMLSNNQIKSISSSAFENLPSLRILKLDGNNLTELPMLVCPILTTLDLSNNDLTSIKGATLKDMVPSVEILKLSNNKIKILNTGAFTDLKLTKLYLNGNSLESVTREWMFGMKLLEYLNLGNNKIMKISTESWNNKYCCRHLKYINLSSNEISHISDGAFKDLKNLKNLNLSNNKMSVVKKTVFQKLSSLEKLDMRNNPIEELTKDAFISLAKLKDLRMNSDELYCSCKLQWFSTWLQNKTFSVTSTCNKPEKLHGKEFTKISVTDLVCDLSRPQITHHPKSQNATKGNEVILSCMIKNGSMQGIKVKWQKNGNNVTESKVKTFIQKEDKFVFYKSNLYLSNVTNAKDGGMYQCILVAWGKEIPSDTSRLRVFDPPKFTSIPGDLETNVGSNVYLNCSASGDPPPKISITIPNHFRVVQQRRIGLEGNTFLIKNISRSDAGLCRCFAKSIAGSINTTFMLNVRGKPVATHEMLDKIVLVNDSAVFICAASGWPMPKYTWFKNGKILDLTSTNLKLRKERNAQHLIILHAGYSDAGRYECRVSNALGSFRLSSKLQVVKKLPDSPGDKNPKTLIYAVIVTAACTMVITTLICVAVLRTITRRGCNFLTVHKTSEIITLDSYTTTTDQNNHEYVHMAENLSNESPRSSSTFVTSSDSRTQSDSQTSSSESGSSKDHRGCSYDGQYDGRHSSGVCSLNSSTSSLASNTNHRNTFPFSNAKTYLYEGTGQESCDVVGVVCNDVSSRDGNTKPRQSLQLKLNEQQYHGRRKHKSLRDKSSRTREKHVNKRSKVSEKERLHGNEQSVQTSALEQYRPETEGTVL